MNKYNAITCSDLKIQLAGHLFRLFQHIFLINTYMTARLYYATFTFRRQFKQFKIKVETLYLVVTVY